MTQSNEMTDQISNLKGWGLYVSFNPELPAEEVIRAAPYLKDMNPQIFIDGCVLIGFQTETEARSWFGRTVGDDGPTKENQYSGPAKSTPF